MRPLALGVILLGCARPPPVPTAIALLPSPSPSPVAALACESERISDDEALNPSRLLDADSLIRHRDVDADCKRRWRARLAALHASRCAGELSPDEEEACKQIRSIECEVRTDELDQLGWSGAHKRASEGFEQLAFDPASPCEGPRTPRARRAVHWAFAAGDRPRARALLDRMTIRLERCPRGRTLTVDQAMWSRDYIRVRGYSFANTPYMFLTARRDKGHGVELKGEIDGIAIECADYESEEHGGVGSQHPRARLLDAFAVCTLPHRGTPLVVVGHIIDIGGGDWAFKVESACRP